MLGFIGRPGYEPVNACSHVDWVETVECARGDVRAVGIRAARIGLKTWTWAVR